MSTGRAPAVFPLLDAAMDAAALCAVLRPCLPLQPAAVSIQPVYYLDTAGDALYRSGGVLLAKPQSAYWSLLREHAASGRPSGGSRADGMPGAARELPVGPLREQLQALIGEHALQPKGRLQLTRQVLSAPGEAPRLLLEAAMAGERLIGRRLLLTRRPGLDRLEGQLLERLTSVLGSTPGCVHSWYPRLRPDLAVG